MRRRVCTLEQARELGIRTILVNGNREDLPDAVILLEGIKLRHHDEVYEVADEGLLAVVGHEHDGTPIVALGWKQGFGRKPPEHIV